MKQLIQARRAAPLSLALALLTIIALTPIRTTAQQPQQPQQQRAEFTATTAAGERLHIKTATTAGMVEIKLRAGTKAARVFQFTASEMQALIEAKRDGSPLTGSLKTTRDNLAALRDAVRTGVDKKALAELTRQVGASDAASGTASAGERARGLSFVRAAMGGAAANTSCLDWALLDYRMCMIEEENDLFCTLSGLMMLISCYW